MRSSVFVSIALLVTSARASYAQERNIKALSNWLGTWHVDEVFMPGTKNEIRTKSTRTCAYFLKDTYIKCETIEHNEKGAREYQFLINYNEQNKRFEMLSVYSNWSQQRRDVIVPDSAGTRWDVIGLPTIEHDVERRIWGVMEFKSDKITWTGKLNTSLMKPDEWTLLYIETSTRKK